MIELNAGNLWSSVYLDKVIELNKSHDKVQVTSIFGSVARLTPTARSADRLPSIDIDVVPEYCKRAEDNGIAIRYTLNQSCIGAMQDFYQEWKEHLMYTLGWLHNKCGVHEWTVCSPLLVERLSTMFPDDFVEVSTISEVATPTDALRWKALGAKGVNLSTSINRNFDIISKIKEIFPATSILTNEACLYECPWRAECYNLSSHNSLRTTELFDHYPFSRCNKLRISHPEEWLKSRMIAPQWIPEYVERTGVTKYKIAYRTHPIEVAIPILEKYMDLSHEGNFLDLWPTIAALGATGDPRNMTYISTKRLDEARFMKHWEKTDPCNKVVCGTECKYCMEIYSQVTARNL